MKVLVCGGRDYSNYDHLGAMLDEIHEKTPITTIVHGAAKGADLMAGIWARLNGIPIKGYPADWKRHGRAAGPIRNQEMLDKEHPDLVVAFPGGTGTAGMVKLARVAGVEVIEAPQ
ncbi:MAG TPA: DUF2493 domain-containing protein [Fimbriimonadaceae bacterium]|nr:DUF2493 domain-containing protein [Fimbriimonadaceae bacterium]